MNQLVALSIPSPSQGVWHLGPLPIRAYALAIILGVLAAVWTGERRWVARGGTHGQIGDIALWAVPAGLVGARAYHVATDHNLYFGNGADPVGALEIWHGGLGIWGAIAGGLLGAWFYCRRHGILLRPLADALAPSVLLAQVIGRFGNYFNQELYGPPTSLPWGIAIDCAHRVVEYPCTTFPLALTHFHPLFLYESLSGLIGAGLLVWLSRRPRPWLRVGDLVAIMFIWIGGFRFLLEFLRIDNWRLAEIPTAQIFGIGFVIVGIALLVIRHRQDAPILGPAPRAPDSEADGHGDGDDTGDGPEDDAADDDFKDFDEAIRARS